MKTVCVFCGSNFGINPAYREAAVRVGSLLAARGVTLVYGGGKVGMMGALADAFLALPGGFGTWDEFCEAVTWSQLGLHRKACAILNVEGFYDAFLAQADRATKEGFVSPVHRSLVISGSDPDELLDRLEQYQVPQEEKWYNR
jgi:predicted Rossmann-fold nucleotide-binding protein